MAIGYVIITTRPATDHEVYSELSKVSEIVELHRLIGGYDMLAKVAAEDLGSMGRIIVDKIRTVRGVIGTKTLAGILPA